MDSSFEIHSNENEWDTCSDITEDIEVDTIHTYTYSPYEGQGSRSRLFEFRPQHIYDTSENKQLQYERGNIDESTIKYLETVIDLTHATDSYDNISIMTLTATDLNPPNDSLPLIYPDLIDWEEPEHNDIPIF